MSSVTAGDGVELHFEVTGEGPSLLFLHEFAGDLASWESQVSFFSARYRCVTFNARGYPPSDVPDNPDLYSQDIAIGDAFAVMDAAGCDNAHVVGHSMGAYTALHMGIRQPGRVRSVVAASCGWGSDPATRDENTVLALEIADMFETEGIGEAARRYADFPMRHRFRDKDPEGWAQFAKRLSRHSAKGSALTMANVQARRPTLFDMKPELETLAPPLLVIVGDEDEACLAGSLMLKKCVPNAGLLIVPRASHTINSEEPDLFNRAIGDFLAGR